MFDEDRYVEGIREAVDSGVLWADSGLYEFRHSLTREAILSELLPFELRRLHAMVAAGLENTAESSDAVTSSAIAAHWNAAGDRERTVVASHRAATTAYSVNAFPEAWRHYQRVPSCSIGRKASWSVRQSFLQPQKPPVGPGTSRRPCACSRRP